MRNYRFIDILQRRINSVLFRLIIILYSIFLLIVHKNEFSFFIYLISFFLYFGFYLNCLKLPILRLFNDFIFISIILIGKDPNEVLNFIFLMLPIINSINFSGRKKSMLVYIFTIIIYLSFSCYYNKKYDIEFIFNRLTPLVSIVFLWLINYYTSLRNKIRIFREDLNDVVDNFYIQKEFIKKPHKIYKELIKVIQENIKSDLIEEIICFTVTKNDRLVMLNGSSFIWSFHFKHDNILDKIRTQGILLNQVLFIENRRQTYNLTLYKKVEEDEYVYVFITKKTIPFYYVAIGFFRTLEPPLSKISSVFSSEKKLQELKYNEIRKLSERSQYVSRANKTMHYMRNRLGPFSNLLKMLDTFDTIPQEKHQEFKELLLREKDRAQIELKNITERANDMLEKSNNPFVYDTLLLFSIEKIFTILKRNWTSFFPNLMVTLDIKSFGTKRHILINEEGFELFLSDWLNNMAKYKKNAVDCIFQVDENDLTITFINDHKESDEDINQIITDLMSSNRNEIMKRTTHGLSIIKSTLQDMNIDFHIAENEKKQLVLKLKLPIS